MGNDSTITVLSQFNEQGESAIMNMSSHDVVVITTPNGKCSLLLNEIMNLIKQAGKDGLGLYYKEQTT